MRDETDTIAARATPPGEGAIAILRISGPRSHAIIRKCFKPHSPQDIKYNILTLGGFIDPEDGTLIDEVLCVQFQKPHSYTGEDGAEIQCHGSPAIITRGLAVLCRLGARPAGPGEFSRRAFLNGKMDLTRAEAVCDLIRSRTDRAARLALRQIRGGLFEKIKCVKEIILSVGAEIEARLDFPEEMIDPTQGDDYLKNLNKAGGELERLIRQGSRAQIFRQGARVSLLGKPNTGKSSLFNDLLKMERAIVTPHPGTTRDFIEGTVDLEGCPVTYVDTAGMRKSESEVELLGIEKAKSEISQADLVLFLIDASSPLDEEDKTISQYLGETPFILVVNKTDLPEKVNSEELTPIRKAAVASVMISALTNEGVDALETRIVKALLSSTPFDEDAVVTNQRHLDLLDRALSALRTVRQGFDRDLPGELLMIDIREALHFLDRITGEEITEDILDHIFKKFCIGK